MHTVTQLRQAMPEMRKFIRRSHNLTKAAVIATGPDAERTLVVTSAVERGGDYHLVHMFSCRPKLLMDQFPHDYNELELRPETWHKLEEVIRSFLEDKSEEELIESAY